jgi:DNA topoisomerase-3
MAVYLNVAEKPSVARAINQALGGSNSRVLATKSQYNQVYEFPYNLKGENIIMRLTSVTGHVCGLEFAD